MNFPFPKNFLFGAASSACQIESGCFEGGKGEDVHQHYYTLRPDRYVDADPEKSADFYHRYRDDILDMKELGLKAFRFSISWSRIYPEGPTRVEQAGIDYYNDMINALKEAGIVAFFDLYHCDLPYWVIEMGGAANPEFIDWFVAYAKTCFEAFGDRVDYWSTVNEPITNITNAYARAATAPFLKDMGLAMKATHNMLLAHYKTIKLYKSMGFSGKIGAVNHLVPPYTVSNSPEDRAAAERWAATYYDLWMEPMLLGHYPEVLFEDPLYADNLPKNAQQELAENFEDVDFIGANIYGGYFVGYDKNQPLQCTVVSDTRYPKDAYNFSVYPQAVMDVLLELHQKYPGKHIIITENGISKKKWGNLEEERKDEYRVDFMREQLREVSRAISLGIPVDGYFHWSIMDTNEIYVRGYDHIFGLRQVDFETKERFRRDSWYYYQRVIADGAVD